VRLCHCAAVYPDKERSIVGRQGCGACDGSGVVPTVVTAAQRATLAAGGWRETGGRWRETGGRWRHSLHGTARVEAALALAEGDERAARKAAERTATT